MRKKSAKTRSVLPVGAPAWWDDPAPQAPDVRGDRLEQIAQILERCNVSIPASVTGPRSRRITASGSDFISESIGDGCFRTAPKPGAD